MTRPVLFFLGLFATIALTVVAGEWLVPNNQPAPVFGLEVDPTQAVTPSPTPSLSGLTTGTVEPTSIPSGQTPSPTPTPTPAAASGLTLRPTLNWVNVFSQASTLDGAPIPVGSVVEAFDPEGVLAGRFTVTNPGLFGLMAVYFDDPSTPVDEGVVVGDTLTFTIDGRPAQILGPDSPTITGNVSVLRLNLSAG